MPENGRGARPKSRPKPSPAAVRTSARLRGSLSTFVDGDGDGDGCAEPVQRTGAGGHTPGVGLEGATRKRSVTQVSHDSIVVGKLHLIRRAHSEERTVKRMTRSVQSGPSGEYVVESTVGIEAHRSKRVAIRPGVARRRVARHLPGVVEDQVRYRGGTTTCEHPDLVRIGPCIEVAAHEGRVGSTGHLGHEPCQLPCLRLASRARPEGVVEHGEKQLDRTPFTIHDHVGRLPETRPICISERTNDRCAHRPARHEPDSRHPILLFPFAHEVVMGEAQLRRHQLGLGRFALSPGLHQTDQVRRDTEKRILDPFLPELPVLAVTTPDVPRRNANGGRNQFAIGCVRVETHDPSLSHSPWRCASALHCAGA